MATLEDRITEFFEANPEASLSTKDGMARFCCTEHSLRQSMYRLRRQGVPVRCERVYKLRSAHKLEMA